MKAKGMSGAEIWDVGVIYSNPEAPIKAGPPFLGPESLKAINHAIDEAGRLGLHLGLIASSSWNAGGSWIQPPDAMKGVISSEITVEGPARLAQLLPFPPTTAPKGADGLPLWSKEIAVLAFPQTTNRYDVTGIVRPGKNILEVKVTNVWVNRLAADALLPQEQRITRLTQKVPIGKPMDSGLFGPVRLLVVDDLP